MSKFIFERLVSKDFSMVYYLIIRKEYNQVIFYTQSKEAQNRLLNAENIANEFFEIYTTLYKTNRELVDDSLFEWKEPARSRGIGFSYEMYEEAKKARRREGKRIMVRLTQSEN